MLEWRDLKYLTNKDYGCRVSAIDARVPVHKSPSRYFAYGSRHVGITSWSMFFSRTDKGRHMYSLFNSHVSVAIFGIQGGFSPTIIEMPPSCGWPPVPRKPRRRCLLRSA
jgi:hypothetical protein